MRLSILDGIRGHLLLGMFIAHLGFQPGMGNLFYIHHFSLLGLYDAEFFVAISGLLVGILIARRADDSSYFSGFIRRRVSVIYKYYLLAAIPALAQTIVQDGNIAPLSDVVKFMFGIIFIQEGSAFGSILSIYLYCFLIMAACYAIAQFFGRMSMLTVSFFIYIAGQFADTTGLFGLSSNFLIFNIATWQFLFCAAFLVGTYNRQFIKWFEVTSDQTKISLFLLCVIGFAYFNVYGKNDLMQGSGIFTLSWVRYNLHPYYLLSIVCVCFGFSLVMLSTPKIFRPFAGLLNWYFSLSILRNIGTYSIQMFVLHVYLMAVFTYLMSDMSIAGNWMLAIAFLAFFVIAPNVYVWFKARRNIAPSRV